MRNVTGRLSLMLVLYVANTASLFVAFKAAALTLSPSQNVLLLSIHSVSMFASQVADLGYSRPANRNLAQRPELAEQASYYFKVNVQRFLMMLLCLPVAYVFMPTSGQTLPAILGVLLVIGFSLRSPWLVAANARLFRLYSASEIIFSSLAVTSFAAIIFLGYQPTLVVILSILVASRLGSVLLVSERLFHYISPAVVFRLDRDIFRESLDSLGIRLILLGSHWSNGLFVVVLFTQAEVGMYLQADKLFYAGVGSFAFLAQELVRLATAGHFQRVRWYVLGASCFALFSVVSIFFALTAPFFLKLVFSASYVGATEPLRWMLLGFPILATNFTLGNAYLHHRRHDGFALKLCSLAAFGNLLTVATAYFMMRPNAAAFGVIASEGAVFLFMAYTLRKGVQTEGDNAAKPAKRPAPLQPGSDSERTYGEQQGVGRTSELALIKGGLARNRLINRGLPL
jgi:O-antigen/teichoic acid export membrane protein